MLSKYAYQIESQRQYQYGSDSPFNASTTLAVQSETERKKQNAANVQSALNYLGATDSTLTQVTNLTDNARQAALEAINTLTSAGERSALADTIKQSIQQLFSFGNYSYNGRYVFAGSTTGTIPFQWGKENSYTVQYGGVENDVYSWSNTDLLSKTNVNGSDVFGAISTPVRGTTDLNPPANDKTLLSHLNGGKGVEKGSIRLNYTVGNKTQSLDIDLSNCVTLGDVKRKIENIQNPDFKVNVEITNNNLILSTSATAGTLSVSEVGRGTVARQLGLPTNTAFDNQTPLNGKDINPAVASTTLLSDILGSKAALQLAFSGVNNNITIQSQKNGTDLNGLKIALQADETVAAGNETAAFDAATNTVLIRINPENTTANDIIKAVNDAAADTAGFPAITATLDGFDRTSTAESGTGLIPLLPGNPVAYGELTGGGGEDFDEAGLQITNDNRTFTVSFAQCKTVGDLLAELNNPDYGLQAEINETGNGINIRSRVSGADFCIGENGGTTAHQLGVRTTDLDTQLSEFDYGRGVSDYDGPGTPASALYDSVGTDNALLLTARNEGKAWNGYQLRFEPTQDPDEKITVRLDEDKKEIVIGITPGATKACEIITAFNTLEGADGKAIPREYFDLTLDQSAGINTGGGVVFDGCATTANGTDGGIDFTITRNDGTVLEIDVKGAEIVADILNIINNHPDNKDGKMIASLAKNGNGIVLTDTSTNPAGTAATTRVDRTLLSTSAIELGLIDYGQEARAATSATEPVVLTGNDPNPKETDSLYNAMIRLQRGMETNDSREIERAAQLLDAAVARMNENHATLGVMQKSLDNVAIRLEDEAVLHQETLNQTLRIDYADSSLAFLAQQLTYQGSMQMTSMMMQLTLLNYL
ncbi:hypothetical protein FACS189419_07490 [Planctomycetales bacterium]|nr:hypothetical protein FACS189419_07490 [Planctomycetales bacterium]